MEYKKLLKSVGFTEYEQKVYLALAEIGTAKASQISSRSSVPSNKVYECLIKLAEKGFIASLDISPRQYRIVGVQKFKDIITKKEKEITNLKDNIESLESDLAKNIFQTKEIAVALKGKKKIMQMLQEITPKILKYQFNLGGNLIFSHTSARLIKEAINRGVDFKFLVHNDPSRKDVYQKWKNIGVKIRFYQKKEQKSIRFSSFDGKIARITIGKPQVKREEDYLSFWIESPAFALLLKDQFLEMWKKGKEMN